MKLFVINTQDVYAGTEGLALGILAAHPEKPSVAHVVQGQVAVWASGQHAPHWSLQPATSAQVIAYERAPRVAAVAEPPQPPAALVPASAAAALGTLSPAGGGNSWDAIVGMAMQSGLMTPGDLRAALPLLASGTQPSTALPTAQHDWDEVIAQFGGQRRAAAPAHKPALDPAGLWDKAIAAMYSPQRN